MKKKLLAVACALMTFPAFITPAQAAADDAIVTSPARIISAGGLVYSPVYLGVGHNEFGVAGGLLNQRLNTQAPTLPFGLAGAGGAIDDGLNWAVLLSAESQIGLRQRYAAGNGWSWGGAYIGRFNLAPGGAMDYGATYKNSLLLKFGGLELTAQPEVGYLMNGGFRGAAALGADLWVNDRISVGANGQYNWNLGNMATAPDRRWGAGAKYLFNENAYLWLNYVSSMDTNVDVGLIGFGYYN
ncbi:MAG: hypothetical protein VKN33_02520 [Candidatus Sericytochromatia bacterium]|nr:hypothetical protein [Candidatus Sericytochromatia bacterium]